MFHLCKRHGYSLIEISENGVNAFFVRDDILTPDDLTLTPSEAYKNKLYPNGEVAPTLKFWEAIKELPYVDVTQLDASSESRGVKIN